MTQPNPIDDAEQALTSERTQREAAEVNYGVLERSYQAMVVNRDGWKARAEAAERRCGELEALLLRIYGWDMMDTAADGPYWRGEMEKLGIAHPDPARKK